MGAAWRLGSAGWRRGWNGAWSAGQSGPEAASWASGGDADAGFPGGVRGRLRWGRLRGRRERSRRVLQCRGVAAGLEAPGEEHAAGAALRLGPVEDGLEARVLLARGKSVGVAFHCSGAGRLRTVLLGPVAEALGEVDGWLDGLDPFEALERVEGAMQDVTPEELEEALAAWEGLAGVVARSSAP